MLLHELSDPAARTPVVAPQAEQAGDLLDREAAPTCMANEAQHGHVVVDYWR